MFLCCFEWCVTFESPFEPPISFLLLSVFGRTDERTHVTNLEVYVELHRMGGHSKFPQILLPPIFGGGSTWIFKILLPPVLPPLWGGALEICKILLPIPKKIACGANFAIIWRNLMNFIYFFINIWRQNPKFSPAAPSLPKCSPLCSPHFGGGGALWILEKVLPLELPPKWNAPPIIFFFGGGGGQLPPEDFVGGI